MKHEVLVSLVFGLVEDAIDQIELPQPEEGERGPRGPRGQRGKPGEDFVWEDHADKIKSYVRESALKFEDLTEKQKLEITGPKGDKGERGRSGKDFSWSEHQEKISQLIYDNRLKFEDLSEDQKLELKGRDGQDGKDFIWSENEDRIKNMVYDLVLELGPQLKLTFNDLSEEEKKELRGEVGERGPQGHRGRSGKDFDFEEHREKIATLISAAVKAVREDLKLKFSDLDEDEQETLKLKFEDLSEDDISELRGARGPRGQRGKIGPEGEKGDKGDRGPQGLKGLPGLTGPRGFPGIDGLDGVDGRDAAEIVEVKIDKRSDKFRFIFFFEDGTRLETNWILIPRGGGSGAAVGGGGGGGSATVGTGQVEIYKDGTLVGETSEIDFVGDNIVLTEDGDKIQVEVNQKEAQVDIYDEGNLISKGVNDINFSGPNVEVIPQNNIADWPTLSDVDSMDTYTSENPSAVNVVVTVNDPSLIENTPCNTAVYKGAWVRVDAGGTIQNALADDYDTSNVIGVVVSKLSSGVCTVKISGVTEDLFSGLDSTKDYFLSDTTPGGFTTTAPTASGHVKLEIGKAFGSDKFLVAIGDRVVRN